MNRFNKKYNRFMNRFNKYLIENSTPYRYTD